MGLLDSLKRNRNTTEAVTIKKGQDSTESDQRLDEEEPKAEQVEPSGAQNDIAADDEENREDGFEGDDDVAFDVVERIIKPYSEKYPIDHAVGTTKIISIINQKGGVGKSTTAVNLASILGRKNKQVLLVDLDPQGNATSGLGIDKRALDHCVYDVLLNDLSIEDAILPDISKGLDLLPATINLAGAEVELVSAIARENRLKDALGGMRGRYDYILVDCPPSLGLLTINGLVAADSLLIPIQSEFYALEGVTKLLDSMKLVKTRLNPSLDIFGVLITMYDGRTTLSKQVAGEVRNYFGKQVFDAIIPRTVKLSEAPSFGMSIQEYNPEGKGAQAYRALAEEVIERG